MWINRIVTFGLIALIVGFYAVGAMAQEFGDVAGGQALIDWIANNVLFIVVALAMFLVIIIAIWQQSIVVGLVGFAVVAIIGGVASFVPTFARTLVGGGG